MSYKIADTQFGRTMIAERNAILSFLSSIRRPVAPQTREPDNAPFEFYAELHRLKIHLAVTWGYTLSSCVTEETDTRIVLTTKIVWAADPIPEPDEPSDSEEPMPVGRTCSIQDGSKQFGYWHPAELARKHHDVPHAGYDERAFPTIFRKPAPESKDAITWYEPLYPEMLPVFGVHRYEEYEARLEAEKSKPNPNLLSLFMSVVPGEVPKP